MRDLSEYVDFIAQVRLEPMAAIAWLEGAIGAANALSEFPRSCPLISEKEEFDAELRHTVYHSHRIIFEVNDELATVYIHRFHHTAKRALRLQG